MAENSGIEWTDHTFNPWWGCVKISPACTHCYAATFAGRFGLEWGPNARRRFFPEKHWQEPLKWNRKAQEEGVRRRVFCASMADVFELLPREHPQRGEMEAARLDLWELIENTPWLDWLLLTKRPEEVRVMVPGMWLAEGDWPANVWVGTTVENQEQADLRIPHLIRIPAPVRFLSCEPLLGPVDIRQWLEIDRLERSGKWVRSGWKAEISWVILGGESGPGSRPFHLQWARDVMMQCAVGEVPCFVKQLGAKPINGYAPPGGLGTFYPLRLQHPKGGDWSEWPEDLRVRLFPEVRA